MTPAFRVFLKTFVIFLALASAVIPQSAHTIFNLPITAKLLNGPFVKNKSAIPFTNSDNPGNAITPLYMPDDISEKAFYQLRIGDIKEFIENSNAIGSKSQQINKDTVLSNGITYRQIKWTNLANSILDVPRYEYQRVDSVGKVYIFYNNEDRLLYDFSKNKGDIYPSPYPGLKWKVVSVYGVSGFNNHYKAVELHLIDSSSEIRRRETITEYFGLTYYYGSIDNNYTYLEGSFWGAILDNTTYGELLAIDNKTEWNRYYPLHIGDMWKYKVNMFADLFSTTIIKAVKDTVLSDGNIYIKKVNRYYSPNYPEGYDFERLDSSGNIYEYAGDSKRIEKKFQLSSCVGDTFYNTRQFLYRIENKYAYYDSALGRINYAVVLNLKGTMWSHEVYFAKDIGVFYINAETTPQYLVGAVINGKAIGDTSHVTSVEMEEPSAARNYELFQNFPNPFNPSTAIKFELPCKSGVSVKIYDLLGREIKELINEEKNAGSHILYWNGQDNSGQMVSSGVYLYRLRAGTYSETRKMNFIK